MNRNYTRHIIVIIILLMFFGMYAAYKLTAKDASSLDKNIIEFEGKVLKAE